MPSPAIRKIVIKEVNDASDRIVRQLHDQYATQPDVLNQKLGDAYKETLEELEERELILQSLQRTNGNKARAAELLGINRTTLNAKIKRLNLGTDESWADTGS